MPAFQAQTTTSAMLAATNPTYETLLIQNLGPNAVYIAFDAAAATTTGTQIVATTGSITVRRPPYTAVNIIAATANQASPADTRYLQQI